MTQESDKNKIFKMLSSVPWWHLFRILSLVSLAVIIVWPFLELQAMQSSVVFSKGKQATLAWDPPSTGIVDHYVIEVTTARQLAGPSNVITWINYYTSKENRYTFVTRDGYTYSFRVKAVGPSGNESPYSDERLTIICDSSSPWITISPVEEGGTETGYLHLTGNFSDNNLAEIEVEGKKATLDFANKTWYVTIPLDSNTNNITVTATDYAGNVFSQQLQVRDRPLVIDTDPKGGEIFVMGTPAYPGNFFSDKAVTIHEVIEPDLRLPITVKKPGYMQLNTVLFPKSGQDTITLTLRPLHSPLSFAYYPVVAPGIKDVSRPAYTFMADTDLDGKLDILVNYPGKGAFVVKTAGEIGGGDWNATVLDCRMASEPAKEAKMDGQLFYIDYDGDLQYELLAPSSQDGKIHIFEHNGKEWTSDTEWVVHFSSDPGDVKMFGFLDWNNDHNKDIFLRSDGEQLIHVFINQGSDIDPWFTDSDLTYTLVDLSPSSTITTCDWDSDGRVDFLGKDTFGRLCVWLNVDNGGQVSFIKRLLPIAQGLLPGNVFGISAADWNQDGIYDLLVGTDTGKIFLLIGGAGVKNE